MRLRSIIPAFPGPWANRFADLPILKTVAQEGGGDISELEDLEAGLMEAAAGVISRLETGCDIDAVWQLGYLKALTFVESSFTVDPWPEYPSFQQLWEQA